MARHTTTTAIRKYRSQYYQLMAHEARLNEQLYHMGQRIKAIAQDEERSKTDHIRLTDLLAQATKHKDKLDAQPSSRERDKQLKKAESVYKDINARFKRSEYHLAVLEKKKDKDNAVKYVLKEQYRDQVRLRAEIAYTTWKQLEQIYQRECEAENRLLADITSLSASAELQTVEIDIREEFGVQRKILSKSQAMIVFGWSNQCLFIITPVKSFFLIRNACPDIHDVPVHLPQVPQEYLI